MNRFVLFCIVILMSSSSALLMGQSEVDSLCNALVVATDDSVKIEILFSWSDLIFEESLRDDIALNEQVIAIAVEHGNEANQHLDRF